MNRYIKNKKHPFLFMIILMIIILGSIGCKSKMSDSKPPEFIHNSNLELDFSPYFNFTSVPKNLLPTWIPEEYYLYRIDEMETDNFKTVVALYYSENEEHFLSIDATYLFEDVKFNYEKDESPVEVIEKDDIQYYIMGNLNTNTFIWRNGSFECQVDGTLSRDELKQMIASIPSK